LSCLTLREAEGLESLDGLHLLGCHLDTTLGWHVWWHLAAAMSLTSATSWLSTASWLSTTLSSSHNQIHESHGVLLDLCVELRLLSLESSHELLEKRGVLKHSLSEHLKLRVIHKSSEARSTFHLVVVLVFLSLTTHVLLVRLHLSELSWVS
jgi:hypothetical protein